MPTSSISAWWVVLVVFWLWFLIDCVKISSRPRFWLSGFWGRLRGSATHGQFAFTAPSPLAWQALTEDSPFSFSPEGLCNVAVGSVGRPGPRAFPAQSCRWEDIREIKAKRGRIYINGKDFCADTPLSSEKALRDLVAACIAVKPDARTRLLAIHLKRWFRPTRLRREIRRWQGATATLAILTTINFSFALAVTVYLLGNIAHVIGGLWAERLADAFPRLLAIFGVIHVAMIAVAANAHRRLMPKKKEERLSLLLSTALLPPQALRLRAQIGAAYFSSMHPLAWLGVTLRSKELEPFAQQILCDLNWPLAPAQPDNAALIRAITSWMRGRITLEADRLVQAEGLATETLLAPPQRDSSTSCTYCPRCGSQFLAGPTHCPQNVKLLALK